MHQVEKTTKLLLIEVWMSRLLGFNLFLFWLTLGPHLSKRLVEFAMHEHYGDIYVFGGKAGSGDFQSAIYKLSCLNIICSWSKVNQSLKEAETRNPIAIAVPDSLCT